MQNSYNIKLTKKAEKFIKKQDRNTQKRILKAIIESFDKLKSQIEDIEVLKVTVSDGDSLWKIADEYATDVSISNREFVQWVQMHNDIDGDQIFPGEKILIPVSNEKKPVNEFASAVN